MSLKELARLANVGGDISYGRKTKEDRIKAENILSSLTDKAQSKAEGNKTLQNIIDAAKFAANFIPGVGPAISAAISAADLVGDTSRASNMKFNLTPEQKRKMSGSSYEDMILQNVNALESQVKGAAKGQRDASILSNLLNIGLSLGGLPGVDTAAKGGVDAATNVATDAVTDVATDVATETLKETAKKTIPGVDPYFPMNQNLVDVKSLITDASQRGEKFLGDAWSGASDAFGGALDSKTGQFLTGKGTQDSLIKSLEGKDWFKALSDTVPGMKTGVGLSQVPIGKTGVNYGSLYGPGKSILTRLMTQYGDATSPAMPKYQRKSLRRRIA